MLATLRSLVFIFFSIFFCLIALPLHWTKNLFLLFNDNPDQASAWQWSEKLYAEVIMTLDEALKTVMPDADSYVEDIRFLDDQQFQRVAEQTSLDLNPDYDQVFKFYRAQKGSETIGYAVTDSAPGKWGVIHYMVCFELNGEIKEVLVLEYQEKRGRPVAKRRFLKQFKGKDVNDDIRVMRDIKGVTGASISSNSMTNGVRKMVHVFAELYQVK